MPPFVLELGMEEIPARFLTAMEEDCKDRLQTALSNAGLFFSGLTVKATPRRLTAFVQELATEATTRTEVVTGPPLKAAYDLGGRPTRAAEGFAKTHGVTLEQTYTLETEKGAYLAVQKKMGGGSALDILSSLCPGLITALPFPKRMRWGDGDITFARPLRWVLALLGTAVVPFTVGKVASGAQSCGHRVHGTGYFTVPEAGAYHSLLQAQGVTLDPADRRSIIKEQGNALATQQKGHILWKETLLDEVQGLCEHPVPLLGSFDPSYLEVPRQVLLTSMESHQKSFGVEAENGNLLPHFLTVLNLTPPDTGLVRKGWERVLRARLEDARFFWKTDLNAGFDAWLAALDSVIFLAPLGSMGDKTRRVSMLCGWLAKHCTASGTLEPVSLEDAMRAGRLSKADLVSAMVKEFDTLQGIMGGIYAVRAGEPQVVAQALSEQYLPAGPDSPVPASLCGAWLSIADKADTLAGCFGLGLIPTGAADPYGLRRAALGIARIAQEKGLRFDVFALLSQALAGYGNRAWKFTPEEALLRMQEFFTLRLKNYFIATGAETLLAEATLQADAKDVWAASARLAALTAFSNTPDFSSSLLTFKRAANIIRKQGAEEGLAITGRYDPALLEDPAEKHLAEELERVIPLFEAMWKEDRYAELFGLLRDLRPCVDGFFEAVMVMCDDLALRQNRLNLLAALVAPLSRLADFAALQQ